MLGGMGGDGAAHSKGAAGMMLFPGQPSPNEAPLLRARARWTDRGPGRDERSCIGRPDGPPLARCANGTAGIEVVPRPECDGRERESRVDLGGALGAWKVTHVPSAPRRAAGPPDALDVAVRGPAGARIVAANSSAKAAAKRCGRTARIRLIALELVASPFSRCGALGPRRSHGPGRANQVRISTPSRDRGASSFVVRSRPARGGPAPPAVPCDPPGPPAP